MPQSGQSGGRRVENTATACWGAVCRTDCLQNTEASRFQQCTRGTAATHGICTVPNRGAICPESGRCRLQMMGVVHMPGTDMLAADRSGTHCPRSADAQTQFHGTALTETVWLDPKQHDSTENHSIEYNKDDQSWQTGKRHSCSEGLFISTSQYLSQSIERS